MGERLSLNESDIYRFKHVDLEQSIDTVKIKTKQENANQSLVNFAIFCCCVVGLIIEVIYEHWGIFGKHEQLPYLLMQNVPNALYFLPDDWVVITEPGSNASKRESREMFS